MKRIPFVHQVLLAVSQTDKKILDGLILDRNKFKSAIFELQKRDFIFKGDKGKFRLTRKGVIKVQRIRWSLNKTKGKAGKGVLVIFDIPERRRRMRDLFRRCLYELGFEKIQKSVFMSKFDVFSELKELVKNCELESCVKYFYTEIKGTGGG